MPLPIMPNAAFQPAVQLGVMSLIRPILRMGPEACLFLSSHVIKTALSAVL